MDEPHRLRRGLGLKEADRVVTGLVVAAGLFAVAGWGVVRGSRRRKVAAQRMKVAACLAPVVDLLAVVVGAGGTVAEAVGVIAERGPTPTRAAFGIVLVRQQQGELLADALGSISAELGSAFHPLSAVLAVAEQGGAPVGVLLQRLIEEAQQARSQTTTEALGRLPVSLLVPLVVCQLPALVIGSVIPLTIVAVRQLDW